MSETPPPPGHGATGRRAVLTAAGATCLLAAVAPMVHARPPVGDQPFRARHLDPRAVAAVRTSEARVALTFDDGPDPAHTPQILDILAAHRVRATFFLIGRAALQHPELVRAIVGAGHAIGNHTQDHLWLNVLGEAQVREDIDGCTATLDGLGVSPTSLFRAPKGLTSPTIATVTAGLHLRSYVWGTCLEANLHHHDDDVAALMTAYRCRPGTIVLAHDGGHLDGPNPQAIDRSRTVAALPALISLIRSRGLDFATLPALLAAGRPVP